MAWSCGPPQSEGATVRILRYLPSWTGAISLLILGSIPASGQTVQGVVVIEDTEEPIPHVNITLVDDDEESVRSTGTDSLGHFTIEVPGEGTYTLLAQHVGYEEVVTRAFEVGPAEVVDVTVQMSLDAVPLDALVVTERRRYPNARIREFYERAAHVDRSGFGRVVWKEDLERYRPHSLRSFLTRYPMGRGGTCRPRVYIDGLNMGVGDEAFEHLDAMIFWEQVEGIEVYRGITQVPPQYNRGGDCAAVLVWSRADRGKPFTWKRAMVAGAFLGLMFFIF